MLGGHRLNLLVKRFLLLKQGCLYLFLQVLFFRFRGLFLLFCLELFFFLFHYLLLGVYLQVLFFWFRGLFGWFFLLNFIVCQELCLIFLHLGDQYLQVSLILCVIFLHLDILFLQFCLIFCFILLHQRLHLIDFLIELY